MLYKLFSSLCFFRLYFSFTEISRRYREGIWRVPYTTHSVSPVISILHEYGTSVIINKPTFMHSYSLKFIQVSFIFPKFFCPRASSRNHIVFSCRVSIGSSWLWWFLTGSLFLISWTVLMSASQVGHRELASCFPCGVSRAIECPCFFILF